MGACVMDRGLGAERGVQVGRKPGRTANSTEALSKTMAFALGLLLYSIARFEALEIQQEQGIMRKKNIFYRLRIITNCAAVGALTASIFFGWIDRSVDLHTVGAVIGATAASLKVFNIV
jgi:hypothetical protein